MPNIIKSFSDVKKCSHYMFPSVEAFHNGLEEPKEMVRREGPVENVLLQYVCLD